MSFFIACEDVTEVFSFVSIFRIKIAAVQGQIVRYEDCTMSAKIFLLDQNLLANKL